MTITGYLQTGVWRLPKGHVGTWVALGKQFPDHKLPYTQFPKIYLPENLYLEQVFPTSSFIIILVSLCKRIECLSPIPNVTMIHCHRIKKKKSI